ncbi:MAG: glycosyltransferase, partial [Actinomycetota bacterium]
MLLSIFLTCLIAVAITTALLLLLGHRLHFSSRIVGVILAAAVAVGAGEAAADLWSLPSSYVQAGEVLVVAFAILIVALRPVWNPIAQVFYGCLLASVVMYLSFAGFITFASGLSPIGEAASALLLLMEVFALVLSCSFAFEGIDVLCRSRWQRPIAPPDPSHLPFVSLHIAAYNEPADMLIETIRSVQALDYPDFEIVVVDNNTKDRSVWQPVYDFCREAERVKFVHVDDWPGYKSGALNLVLEKYTDPRAEIVGVIDADYILDPAYLRSLVGYFADPNVAFVQSPQDYREYENDTYLTACYDAYKYFFATTMPSRNDRNSIIFAGTMGLLRRSAIEELGGWDEWCITEDAETSLRMLMKGYSGVYVAESFGRGIMPLSFAALKSQRFRWCFGGMQILRKHRRDLMPWNRDPENKLTLPQRVDYLLGGLQWLNDLVYLGFTSVLLVTGALLYTKGQIGLRPLFGVAVLLPAALIASGVLRALWSLRHRTGIGLRRAILAFLNWLSMSWTVAVACVQGLVRREGVFMRTPKTAERNRLASALWAARTELLIAGMLWAAGALVAVKGRGNWFLLALFAWQGMVYASAPFMSWLNLHTRLSGPLEERARTEWLRDRIGTRVAFYVGATAGLVALAILVTVVTLGGSNPGRPVRDPFALPQRAPTDQGPLQEFLKGSAPGPSPTPSGPVPGSAAAQPSPSPSGTTEETTPPPTPAP